VSEHETNEALRKAIHIAVGAGAIALKYLTWQAAAALALAGTIANWLILHRLVGRRVARDARGWDAGIVLYPFAILLLILLFRRQLAVPAICWIIIALGDGFAAVGGRVLPLASLPWNRDKTWGGMLTFAVAASAGAAGIALFFHYGVRTAILAALVAAVAETLPLHVDDNITVPFAAAATLAVFGTQPLPFHHPAPIPWLWVGINTLLAFAAWALRSVNVSGLIAGIVLGTIVVIGAGVSLYYPLLAFFVIGTLATKLGYGRKARAGLAQEQGGRRGASHAIANVGVAALCAIAVWRGLAFLPLFMGITALATAACDTTGSEIGQLFGRRAFLATTFKRVEPGTEGALSIEGTLAGVVAALIVAIIGVTAVSHHFEPGFIGTLIVDKSHAVVTITICAFLGAYAESLAGNWNRRHGSRVPNGVLNFFNTAVGAILFFVATHFVPMYGFLF
jgi:uncharacterized protein (TIGR00297 family)